MTAYDHQVTTYDHEMTTFCHHQVGTPTRLDAQHPTVCQGEQHA